MHNPGLFRKGHALARPHLHAISPQRLGAVERGVGIGQEPVGHCLQVRFMRPGDSDATPTDTVKFRSICAVSAKGSAAMTSRMRSASFAASVALASGNRMA